MADIEISVELDLADPPEDLLEYARTELGEDPDILPKLLQEFKDMIYELGECTPHRMDDKYLMRFLRARSFCLPRAHRLLANYYKFKENYPEIHEDVYPLKLRFIGDDDIMSVMPYRDQNGRRILLYRMGNWSPSKYGINELFKATLVVLELGILEQRTQILGGVCIFDLSGISLQHAWNVTPGVARKVVDLMVTSFPMKISAIHILHQSWVFDIIYAIFRPLLSDKMRESIFFHGTDMESLHKHISPKCLSLKYGGMQKEYPYTLWLDALEKNDVIMNEMLSLGYRKEDNDEKIENGNSK